MERKTLTTKQLKTMTSAQLLAAGEDRTLPLGVRGRAMYRHWCLVDAAKPSDEMELA